MFTNPVPVSGDFFVSFNLETMFSNIGTQSIGITHSPNEQDQHLICTLVEM